jgi:hypothetical protein
MTRYRTPNASDAWGCTRRNLLGIGSIVAGALLTGCKHTKTHQQSPNCYLKGTHVLTPQGERHIEDLQARDSVVVLGGKTKQVRWIGRRRFTRGDKNFWDEGVRPVRIRRSALGPDLPRADLLVSQNHRLFLDGLLIRSADLINGSSIALEPCEGVRDLEYLHILLNGHHAILAEGVPSESLLFEPGVLTLFDNCEEYQERYGCCDPSEQPFAPVHAECGRRARLRSHVRSALSQWVDRRTTFDRLRDRLADYTAEYARS